MARNNDRDRSTNTRRAPKDNGRRIKKKVCMFCKEHATTIDYKDVNVLRKFMSDRGKIRARRVSGNCQQHQRDVATAIKVARELALLPYTQRTTSERPGGRGPGRGPREGGYSRPKNDEADAEAAIESIDLGDVIVESRESQSTDVDDVDSEPAEVGAAE